MSRFDARACTAALLLTLLPAIGAGPASAPRALLGLVLETRGRRVVVTEVADGSPAARSGLLPGDVLLVVDDQPLVDLDLKSPEAALERLERSSASHLRLVVGRGAATFGVLLDRTAVPSPAAAPARAPVAAGSPAPEFTARALGGGEVTLSRFKGRPVLIDFWASWCAPCRDASLAVRRLGDLYGDRLVIIGVSLDEDEAAFEAFVYNNHLPGLQIADGGPAGALSRLYGAAAAGIPFSILVSPQGSVAATGRSPAEFENDVARFAGPAAADRAP